MSTRQEAFSWAAWGKRSRQQKSATFSANKKQEQFPSQSLGVATTGELVLRIKKILLIIIDL